MQLSSFLVLSFVGLFSQGALSSPLEGRQVPALCIFNLGTSAAAAAACRTQCDACCIAHPTVDECIGGPSQCIIDCRDL
ncbi:hypothetical protein HYPSUDRAFT_43251 [Hypholoma sublateritium FD-334 SS-4]|uniref:Uncharacterized protein n=1 Tax=Hypholoma sublateritium (strain FD-334 SS-4) TaxID=945553 RepID=A0A0D2NNF3_HYPSF|nr:hypothetical protein HYPSUDRAFT_43251 [Hypholoma sublateritium FD-334 SS-4]